VKLDTGKAFSTARPTKFLIQEDFDPGVDPAVRSSMSLVSFVEQRGAFLLSYSGIRLVEK
jgi:hypothetical protein